MGRLIVPEGEETKNEDLCLYRSEPDEHGVIRCPGHGLRFCAGIRKAVWSYNNPKKRSRT